MIAWMLTRIEKSPHSTFRREELLRKSRRKFDHFRRIGLLVYVQPGEGEMSYPCPVSDCGNVCPMDVVRVKGKYYAVCPENEVVGPTPLTEDDLARYRFSLDVLVEFMRRDNSLGGSAYRITPRLYFLGNRLVERRATAFVLACFPSVQAAEPHLLSLPARLPGHCAARAVVITPSLDLNREPIYPKLRTASIFPATLPPSFGRRDFRVSYLAALQRRPPPGIAAPLPALTASQLADYERHGYLCRDRLHIPGTRPRRRRNVILLNGEEITLADALFVLLMRFVAELKKGAGGWVSPADLAAGGFIIDIEHRQRYSQLREHFKGTLRDRDGEKFIECDRSKGYRLSTHPSLVTCDKETLSPSPAR